MNKLLENEFFEIETKDAKVMKDSLSFISENLKWVEADVATSHIIVMEPKKDEIQGQMELLQDGTCGDVVDKLNQFAPVSDREAAEQCYRESNRFVLLNNERGELNVVPTFHTAQRGLLTRRGCDCPAINGNWVIARPLPSMEEAFLNDSARRCKSTEKWGILDGGCIANASSSYVVLDCFEGYKAFVKEITNTWSSVEFYQGRISYDYYLADFKINDEIAVDGLRNTLIGLGVNVESINAYARYTTSDTTTSAMAATIYYELNGTPIRLANKVGIEHKGDVTMDDFKTSLKDLGMLLKESEDQVEKLGNTEILFSAGCLFNALKKCHLLNKKGKELVEEVKVTNPKFTALDIIIKCNEVLSATADAENWNATKILNVTEEVTRLLNSSFSHYDKPLED